MKKFLAGIAVLAVIITMMSCAPKMTVPVTRPAEINLRGINRIAVGDITGEGGPVIADLLTSRLFESGKFELVDRNQLKKIMDEQKLSLSGAVDEKTAATLGQLIGAASLVYGNVSSNKYDLKTTYKDWKDREGRLHKTYYKTGTAKLSITLKVVGLTTGKIVAVKTISREAKEENNADDGLPEDPDEDAVRSAAVNAVIGDFMKMIAPYTEYVVVAFAPTDSKLPELETGVNLCKAGKWSDGVEQFKSATKKNPAHDGAWYNLGLAYQYSSMFKEAEDAFNEANKIKSSKKYLQAISNVKRMAAERKKLEEQGAVGQ